MAVAEEMEAVTPESRQGLDERRLLRSQYLAVKSLISDERDGMTSASCDKFRAIITRVESLHQLVQRPREQIADAEALLDIANTLVASVRSQSADGITCSDFVTALLKSFGHQGGPCAAAVSLRLGDVGVATSHVFMDVPGCRTMVGPMNTKVKQFKVPVISGGQSTATFSINTRSQTGTFPVITRRRTWTARPLGRTYPEQLADSSDGVKADTDMNMSVIFDILRSKKRARLENLVLNRISFAQTVENIFALSFLVKDGRVEINMDDNGHHIVYPRNAPSASAIASGEASYSHFVFRFDSKDWKLMKGVVQDGEELMPHRSSQRMRRAGGSKCPEMPTRRTPVRKLSRNQGLVVQEIVAENTPEMNQTSKRRCLFQDQE